MATCICACGAKYRFAEHASGKTGRCRRCGESLTLVADPEATGKASTPKLELSAPTPPQDIPIPIVEVESADEENGLLFTNTRERGYWNALGWSLLFPSSIHNLAAFLTLWGVFGFLSCIPLVRISFFYVISIFWIAVGMWYAAFRVEVVESAASGQFRLPDVDISTDFWSDLLEPAIRWYGSWLMVLIPALLYSTVQGYRGVNVIRDTWQAIMNPPLLGVAGPAVDPVLMTLTIVGLFFWPMVALVVIIGGFGQLWRIDRILFTFGNSLAPYLVTVVVVAAAYAIYFLNEAYLSPRSGIWQAPTTSAMGMWFLKRVLATGIELYVGIVAARAIGLYFRHFGHRFAWDWGQE